MTGTRAPYNRQHRGREGIGGHIKKDDVDVLAPELMAGCNCLLRTVDQAQIDDLNSRTFQAPGKLLDITSESFVQPFELGPVSLQSDAEKTNSETMVLVKFWHGSRRGG